VRSHILLILIKKSLKNEEVISQTDRTLSDLNKFIDKTLGLRNTLIELAADHGMADMPEYMTELLK
jgi:hypothetical protein